MKLVLFNLREDEKSALNNWIASHPEVEVDVHSEELTASNKHLFLTKINLSKKKFMNTQKSKG